MLDYWNNGMLKIKELQNIVALFLLNAVPVFYSPNFAPHPYSHYSIVPSFQFSMG